MSLSERFASSYVQSQARFLDAMAAHDPHHARWVLDGVTGLHGEALASDVALIGAPDSDSVIVVSSGVHGIEGYAGAGCQVSALRDEDLMRDLGRSGKALLLIHAVNPYGFSFGRRANEANIDINRNFVDFPAPADWNAAYADVHPLLLPPNWPPSPADVQALSAYRERLGMAAFQSALSSGQYSHADGLFYGGSEPSWSRRMLTEVLGRFVAGRRRAIWIDIHTGLGPHGFGQKILVSGRWEGAGAQGTDVAAQARAIWGADVVSLDKGQSVSSPVSGAACGLLQIACPRVDSISLALEFGTASMPETIDALRFDHWAYRHGRGANDEYATHAREAMHRAFNPGTDEWRGMVWGQTRAALVQAIAA